MTDYKIIKRLKNARHKAQQRDRQREFLSRFGVRTAEALVSKAMQGKIKISK